MEQVIPERDDYDLINLIQDVGNGCLCRVTDGDSKNDSRRSSRPVGSAGFPLQESSFLFLTSY